MGNTAEFKKEGIMAISSVTSGYNNVVADAQAQAQAPRVREVENDGDSDDKRAQAAQATSPAPQPTVNTLGQTVGSIINVQA